MIFLFMIYFFIYYNRFSLFTLSNSHLALALEFALSMHMYYVKSPQSKRVTNWQAGLLKTELYLFEIFSVT